MSQTPPVSAAEPRPGHTSEDGLYHKPSSRPPSPPTAAEPDAPLSDTECPSTSTSKFSTTPKKKAKYPVVHFEGRSRSLHIRWDPNANSHIRGSNPFYNITGTVRASPSKPPPPSEFRPDDNLDHVFPASHTSTSHTAGSSQTNPFGLPPDDDLVIRWTTFSVFHGEPRWKSEGVQIGGLKSARGILGNWFDKDFDVHGPAGPTGFWKISESCERFPGLRDPFSEGRGAFGE